MKITLAANEEITMADLLNTISGFVQRVSFTIKVITLSGDVSFKQVNVTEGAVMHKLHNLEIVQNIKSDMYSVTSENGCSAEFEIWQLGKKII